MYKKYFQNILAIRLSVRPSDLVSRMFNFLHFTLISGARRYASSGLH